MLPEPQVAIIKPVKRLQIWLPRLLLLAVFSAFLWFSSLAISIQRYGQLSDSAPADAAVVLGAAVHRGAPSPVFRERINHAVDLYQAGQVDAIIFTGGIGWNDDQAEAEVGRQYALELGVPSSAIFMESESLDTIENLQGAAAIIVEQGFARVLLVSDPLHMFRAMHIALDLGLEAAPSPTPTSRYRTARSQLPFLLREVLYAAQNNLDPGLVFAATQSSP
jgi:uncharacterized SAM-binding protein YcdF (DUF218 family)